MKVTRRSICPLEGTLVYIKPAPGMQIVDPAHLNTPAAMLSPEGREVQASDYWYRRLRDGDVVLADPPSAETTMTSEVA